MVDRLPNEILQKVFVKCNFNTNGNCRLLNSRYNQIIGRRNLHKRELQRLMVTSCRDGGYALNIVYSTKYGAIIENFKQEENLNWPCNFEKEFQTLSIAMGKISRLSHFFLYKILFNHVLLDLLSKCEVFRKIRRFVCLSSTFDISAADLSKLLNPLRLDSFSMDSFPIGYSATNLRNLLINQVNNVFELRTRTDLSEAFTDDLLDKWLKPGKMFNIIGATTGFTLTTIVKHIKALMANPVKEGRVIWNFGILKTVSETDMVNALAQFGGHLIDNNKLPYIRYAIKPIAQMDGWIYVSCQREMHQ